MKLNQLIPSVRREVEKPFPENSIISPKMEAVRIHFALTNCERHGLGISEPMELIKDAIDEFGDNLAISCSWGSCSVAVLKMALEIKPDINVVFDDTTVEFPETYRYRDLLVQELKIKRYFETKPLMPFWTCWKKYGPPTIRRFHLSKIKDRRTFQEKTGKPACCWFCKDKPFLDFCKANKIEATLTGLRCSESRTRMFMAADYGQSHYTKRHKLKKFHPILFWNNKELSRYFIDQSLPLNEVYTRLHMPRNGCMPCTSYLHFEDFLARYNPKMLVLVQKYRLEWKQRKDNLMDNFLTKEDEVFETCIQSSPSYRQSFLENWFDIDRTQKLLEPLS